jgi:hypothetical protein
MLTPRNPNLWLAALLVLSTACGDDDETSDTDGGGNTGGNTGGSTGNNTGNTGGDDGGGNTGEVDLSASCKAMGTYDGFKGEDIKGKIGTGACTTDGEITEICKINPSSAAAEAGGACFLGSYEGDMLRKCTIEGDAELKVGGLRKAAPNLSDECLECYAESVACSAENGCGGLCVADANADACVKCREDKGCTPTFYDCAGLPRAEDL